MEIDNILLSSHDLTEQPPDEVLGLAGEGVHVETAEDVAVARLAAGREAVQLRPRDGRPVLGGRRRCCLRLDQSQFSIEIPTTNHRSVLSIEVSTANQRCVFSPGPAEPRWRRWASWWPWRGRRL